VLEDKSTVDGVLIILGDQPRIDAALLRQIATTALHHPDRIVAASYASTIGVPALFPEAFFKELQALDPKQGAKPLLERLHDRIVPLMIAQNPDLDTMDEYLEEAGRWPD
jgi:molybdenum cofactor cytidylyltransferase